MRKRIRQRERFRRTIGEGMLKKRRGLEKKYRERETETERERKASGEMKDCAENRMSQH